VLRLRNPLEAARLPWTKVQKLAMRSAASGSKRPFDDLAADATGFPQTATCLRLALVNCPLFQSGTPRNPLRYYSAYG
jgi:hypothetical protein